MRRIWRKTGLNLMMAERDSSNGSGAPPNAVRVSGTDGCVDGEALMNGMNEIRILFRGQKYRLSVTGSGKLLLTK